MQRHVKLLAAGFPFGGIVSADLHRAIHEAVQKRRRPCAIVVSLELRSHLPLGSLGDFELRQHRRFLETVRPDHRRRHIEMRVRGVDAIVGAIGAVAK